MTWLSSFGFAVFFDTELGNGLLNAKGSEAGRPVGVPALAHHSPHDPEGLQERKRRFTHTKLGTREAKPQPQKPMLSSDEQIVNKKQDVKIRSFKEQNEDIHSHHFQAILCYIILEERKKRHEDWSQNSYYLEI